MMRKFGLILGGGALLIVVILGIWIFSRPERGTTGSVSTKFWDCPGLVDTLKLLPEGATDAQNSPAVFA
jgi:hypothetical protein